MAGGSCPAFAVLVRCLATGVPAIRRAAAVGAVLPRQEGGEQWTLIVRAENGPSPLILPAPGTLA